MKTLFKLTLKEAMRGFVFQNDSTRVSGPFREEFLFKYKSEISSANQQNERELNKLRGGFVLHILDELYDFEFLKIKSEGLKELKIEGLKSMGRLRKILIKVYKDLNNLTGQSAKLLEGARNTGRVIEHPESIKNIFEKEIQDLLEFIANKSHCSLLLNIAKKEEGGQRVYIIDENGNPVYDAFISSGRYGAGLAYKYTPTGLYGMLLERTITDAKLGQRLAWNEKLKLAKKLNGSHLMTTAILALDGNIGNRYLHGTTAEEKLGKRDSLGCVRHDNITISVFNEIFKQQGDLKVNIVNKAIVPQN